MRFTVRPQQHSDEYPHDGGHAIWDEVEGRQVGWYANADRAKARADERNARKGPPKYSPRKS